MHKYAIPQTHTSILANIQKGAILRPMDEQLASLLGIDREAAARWQAWTERDDEIVFGFLSEKGSNGKTTIAGNLGAYLSLFGSVRGIDGDDRNRSLSLWARPGKLPFTVMTDKEATLRRERFKFTLLDTKASPDGEDIAFIAKNADFIVIPTEPEKFAIAANVRLVKTLKELGAKNFKILINRAPLNTRRGEDAHNFLKDNGIPIFDTVIRQYEAYKSAIDEGVPVYKARVPGAKQAWTDLLMAFKEIPQ